MLISSFATYKIRYFIHPQHRSTGLMSKLAALQSLIQSGIYSSNHALDAADVWHGAPSYYQIQSIFGKAVLSSDIIKVSNISM